MRIAFLLALLLVATAPARADLLVRPVVGISGAVGDAGFGVGAQLGARISPLLLRLALDIGGGSSNRGYLIGSVRGDWLFPLGDSGASLYAGAGVASVTYGYLFDDPAVSISAVTPGAGVDLGADRGIGRILLGVTGIVPLGAVPHPSKGGTIDVPKFLATLTLSL